jgi:hypothetical protein
MHNRMQELGGIIRVFVPTHPLFPGDGAEHESLIEVCPDGESMSIVDDPCGGGNHSFTFDERGVSSFFRARSCIFLKWHFFMQDMSSGLGEVSTTWTYNVWWRLRLVQESKHEIKNEDTKKHNNKLKAKVTK